MENDPSATDFVALAHGKEVVEQFRRLLTEPDFFAQARAEAHGQS